MREGSALATKLGQTSVDGAYNNQAGPLLCFLQVSRELHYMRIHPLTSRFQSYWNSGSGYITSNTGGGRSGKDSNSILASIHTFDAAAGCDATTFQPCSDKALSNLKVYVDSFRSVYALNNGIAATGAVAVGRYPEDVYYNGNPWYLSTFAVAEQLYDALTVWSAQGSLQVTPTSLAFFRQFLPSVSAGTYASSSSTYTSLTSAIKTFADGFISINAKYTPSGGALAEQFDRATGKPLSAADLTWSYASALTAFAARNGFKGASWGAKGLSLPAQCTPNAGATVPVTFNVQATTVFGGMSSRLVWIWIVYADGPCCREHLPHRVGPTAEKLVEQ